MIIVHSTPFQVTAVFATATVGGSVPVNTPAAALSTPSPSARLATANRVCGSTKSIGPYNGLPQSRPPSSSDASRVSSKTRLAWSSGIGVASVAARSSGARIMNRW